jgi:hypothetical protein
MTNDRSDRPGDSSDSAAYCASGYHPVELSNLIVDLLPMRLQTGKGGI